MENPAFQGIIGNFRVFLTHKEADKYQKYVCYAVVIRHCKKACVMVWDEWKLWQTSKQWWIIVKNVLKKKKKNFLTVPHYYVVYIDFTSMKFLLQGVSYFNEVGNTLKLHIQIVACLVNFGSLQLPVNQLKWFLLN